MSNNPKSLTETINTPAGTFLNAAGFQAVVGQCKTLQTKSGKPFYKAEISEGGAKATITSFAVDFSPLSGKLVKFIGMGLKMGEPYNGVPQITIGDKARIIPVGDAPAEQQAPQAASNATSGQNKPIEGVTVGMAINKAVDLAIAETNTDLAYVYATASSLIRMAQKLQRGELHDARTHYTKPAPAQETAQEDNGDIHDPY